MSEKSDHWCRTTGGDTTVTTFTWTIENFKRRPDKAGEGMYSSIFLAKKPDQKMSRWKLRLYPKGGNEIGDYLSIHLYSCNDFPIKASYRVSILDSSSKETKPWKCGVCLFENNFMTWGTKKWTSRESITTNPELLPEVHLTIFCALTVYGTEEVLSGSKDLEIESRATARGGSEQVIEHFDFGKLFNSNSKEFSDVQIECGSEIFNCPP